MWSRSTEPPTVKALRIVLVAAVIAAVSAGVGLAVNAVRKEGRLPLIRPEPAAFWVDLAAAKATFDQGTAVFVDARLPFEYDVGHVPGALNLPWEDVDSDYQRVLGGIDKTRPIITYCGGPPCDVSAELADALTRDYGHVSVRVLGPEDGLEQWIAEGYPVETKAGGPPARPAHSNAVPILIIVVGALLGLLALVARGGARSALALIARLFIGGLLVYAAYGKILEPGEFAKGVIGYQVVPDAWANLPAIVVPWVEIIAGGLLVIGLFTRASALIASALMAAFTAMMWWALARGIVIDDCHCFGFAEPLSALLIVRDVALLAAALAPLFAGAGWLAFDALRRRVAGSG